MNVTVDDTSFLINYDGFYESTGSYYGGQVSATQTPGHYWTYKFNGTAIYVFGERGPEYGAFQVTIDNVTQPYGNQKLWSGYQSVYASNQLNFWATDLDGSKPHEIAVTCMSNETVPKPANINATGIDLDYLVFTTNDKSEVYTTIYDDSSPAIQYQGMVPHNGIAGYYNGTSHITSQQFSYFSLDFNGTAIQVFGGRGGGQDDDSFGDYSVSLDDGPTQYYTGFTPWKFANATLFVATDLPQGSHNIKVTNEGTTIHQLDVDWIVVNSTVPPQLHSSNNTNTTTTSDSPNPSNSAANSNNNGSSSSSSSSHAGAVAGGVVGGLVALAALIFGFWCYRRRKNNYKRAATYDPAVDLNSGDDAPGTRGPNMVEIEPFRPFTRTEEGGESEALTGATTASLIGTNAVGSSSQSQNRNSGMRNPVDLSENGGESSSSIRNTAGHHTSGQATSTSPSSRTGTGYDSFEPLGSTVFPVPQPASPPAHPPASTASTESTDPSPVAVPATPRRTKGDTARGGMTRSTHIEDEREIMDEPPPVYTPAPR